MLHHCIVINIKGESYRLKKRKEYIKQKQQIVNSLLSGAANGDRFKEYLKELLAETLHPGDILVMDNLRSHKVNGVAELIESAGATVFYLPPYSPELNPIEQMWDKLKAYLRMVKARFIDALLAAIPDAFRLVSTDDIRGWCSYTGYCH